MPNFNFKADTLDHRHVTKTFADTLHWYLSHAYAPVATVFHCEWMGVGCASSDF